MSITASADNIHHTSVVLSFHICGYCSLLKYLCCSAQQLRTVLSTSDVQRCQESAYLRRLDGRGRREQVVECQT